ncbi:hypothetical protein DMN91_010431 [Ooceraea biroi]|uniref:Uncharacterized protein n=1 Tax=Ooceraea biroi TaxID=2015173 RepID=A0A026WK41_OOCBI|nr:uncharacterized protein LOC105278290 [Ooceraea biroi]EZA56338.1 hypothetical protein X777_02957 [Ooceraea biroi]RLU18188.1 hypothetical protein DMN91_010431 [Ooceraea biroi]
MKRSPLSTPRGFRGHGPRQAPYNWKSQNANSRGYHSAGNESCQRFVVDNEAQPRGNDFIPLNVSTPVTQHEKHGARNWHSPAGGHNNVSPRGWHNYRGNYHGNPRLNSSNRGNSRYAAYKHPGKKFHGQNKMGYKSAHRQHDISVYVDVKSMLGDPWADLVKNLNDSKDKSTDETPKTESSSFNTTLTDCDSTKESESKLSEDTNLDNLQCNQDSRNVSPVETSFEDTNLPETSVSEINISTSSKTDDDTCSNQNSVDESACNVNEKVSENAQEENTAQSNVSVMDSDDKNIEQ